MVGEVKLDEQANLDLQVKMVPRDHKDQEGQGVKPVAKVNQVLQDSQVGMVNKVQEGLQVTQDS